MSIKYIYTRIFICLICFILCVHIFIHLTFGDVQHQGYSSSARRDYDTCGQAVYGAPLGSSW